MKSRFWGKTFEITPAGYTHLLLAIPRSEWPKLSASDFGIDHNNTEEAKKYGLSPYEPEVYYWKKVSTYVTNFVFGKMKLENRGNITVVSKTTGVKSSIGFVKPKSNMSSWITDWGGGSSKDKDDVEVTIKGEITSEVGEVIWEITGNHFKHIFARPSPNYAGKLPSSLKNGFVAWSAEPYPPGSKNNYDFTYTALSLNQLTPQLRSYLPSSDSRLRPDQRHMEDGAWDKASVCKEALEMYQRRSRASLVNLYSQTAIPSQRPDYDEILNSIAPENQARHIGESWWRPRWFVNCYDTITKTNYWRFTGDYWSWRNVVFPNPQDAKKSKWPPWVPDMYHEKNIENLLSDSPGEKIT